MRFVPTGNVARACGAVKRPAFPFDCGAVRQLTTNGSPFPFDRGAARLPRTNG